VTILEPRMRLTLTAAGHKWDALRVSAPLGEQLIAALDFRCGDVMRDGHTRLFLIPPGTGDFVTAPGVAVYGRGRHLLIPAMDLTVPPGPHWVRQVPRERRITSVVALNVALLEVTL